MLSEQVPKENCNIFYPIDVALPPIDGLEDCPDDKTSLLNELDSSQIKTLSGS